MQRPLQKMKKYIHFLNLFYKPGSAKTRALEAKELGGFKCSRGPRRPPRPRGPGCSLTPYGATD